MQIDKEVMPVTLEAQVTVATDVPQPIFIIGSYRSGTSVLTWALGQHANLFPLEETNWIYKLGLYLDRLYDLGSANGRHSHLSSMEMKKNGFYRSFGKLVDSFILENRVNCVKSSLKFHLKKNNLVIAGLEKLTRLEDFAEFSSEDNLLSAIRNRNDTKKRWVDGTPENSHFVYCLNMMFPEAKFIFLLRNPIKVAHSLMNFTTVGGAASNYEEENAYNQWYCLTEACYYALKAFGSGKVLLMEQEQLISQREDVVKRCLSFINEEYDMNCLKPLQVSLNSSQYDRSGIDFSIANGIISEKPYVQNACQLYNHILADSPYDKAPSLHYYRLLRNKYLDQAKYFY